MVPEKYAKHIPNFSFVPISTFVQTDNRLNSGQLVRISLQPDPGVVLDAQEVVDDFESSNSAWNVDGGDVGQAFVTAKAVLFEELNGRVDAVRVDHDFELVAVGDLDVLCEAEMGMMLELVSGGRGEWDSVEFYRNIF